MTNPEHSLGTKLNAQDERNALIAAIATLQGEDVGDAIEVDLEASRVPAYRPHFQQQTDGTIDLTLEEV